MEWTEVVGRCLSFPSLACRPASTRSEPVGPLVSSLVVIGGEEATRASDWGRETKKRVRV